MITLSDKAVQEIKRIKEKEPNSDEAKLRIMVVGGGCSGMSYKLGFESKEADPSDKIIDQDGVSVVVDSKSMLFLSGMTLDFSDGLNGKGFVFENPNAKRNCGCGSSFSV